MTIATCAKSQPWAAPVFYAADRRCNLFFVSAFDSRHASNLDQTSVASAAIFDSGLEPEEADGVQLTADARRLDYEDLPYAMDVVYGKRFPDPAERALHRHPPEDFLGAMPRRFFRLTPTQLFVLDRSSGGSVDRRQSVDLAALVERLAELI